MTSDGRKRSSGPATDESVDGIRVDHCETTLFVRPIGTDASDPIARRVGDRALFLGNRHAAGEEYGDAFDHVLSLTAERQARTTQHRPLVDGPANDWVDFAAAVDAARRLHRADGRLLVHCSKGISRSPAVVAALLAVEEERSVADALAAVQDARRHAVAHPTLHAQAVVYASARE